MCTICQAPQRAQVSRNNRVQRAYVLSLSIIYCDNPFNLCDGTLGLYVITVSKQTGADLSNIYPDPDPLYIARSSQRERCWEFSESDKVSTVYSFSALHLLTLVRSKSYRAPQTTLSNCHRPISSGWRGYVLQN